ncbi:hypothetical protein KAU15_01860 [candidate division WOR-3 bacterium]|nr:hypothetical protein [candidate division WOR-3 bacterium]
MILIPNIDSFFSRSNFIVFAGCSDEGIRETIKSIKKRYVDDAFKDLDYFEMFGDEFDNEIFSSYILSPPMISEKKIIVIRNGIRLSVSQMRSINELAKDTDNNIILIIVITDRSKLQWEIISRVESGFSDAVIIKTRAKETLSINDVKTKSIELGLSLTNSGISKIMEISDSNRYVIDNILITGWMTNDDAVFEQMLSDKYAFETSPAMYLDFLNLFMEKNKKKCFIMYRKLTKWNIISIDGLVGLIMNRLEKIKKAITFGNSSSNQIKNESWSISEIDKTYFLFYNVLRKFRTINKKYAALYFEQVLLYVLNH